jgi:transcriptional regulator with XRE-family HTH domain
MKFMLFRKKIERSCSYCLYGTKVDEETILCSKKGISPSRAAIDAGISKSLVTKWRTNSVQAPSPDVLMKLAKYFNMSVSELLGEETEKAPTKTGERPVSDDEIKFALFGGDGEITDAMYQEVKEFAALIKLREAMKKKE